jgi:ABC-type Na+ efflux pump permease subunit
LNFELPNLPIVERELRVSARRPMTYWGRTGYALLAMLLISWALWMRWAGMGGGPMVGRPAFFILAFVAIITALGTALRLTAPSIATEKREGTLGLLFLTDLKPRDVVFGKLAVTSLETLARFLAIVPVLAIPILIGGVTAGDLARLVLVLLNTMFLAAAIGMFASCLSVDEKGSAGLGMILTMFAAGATPLLAVAANRWELPPQVAHFLFTLSPAYACINVFNPVMGLQGFWISIVVGHAFGWLLLWWTCRLLPHMWQDRPATAKKEKLQTRVRNFTLGDREKRHTYRTALLEVSPLLWINSRERHQQLNPWVFLVVVAGLLLWGVIKLDDVRWDERGLVLGVTWLLHMIFKTWIGSQSSASLSTDRDRGALELLLSTPMTTADFIRGHWLGLKRLFAKPLLVLLACEALWVLYSLVFGRDEGDRSIFTWLFLFGAHYVVFFADLRALGWLGLWMGVNAKNAQEAASGTQLRVLLLPWIGLMLSMALFGCLIRFNDGLLPIVFFWTGWSLFIDIAYTRLAKRRLQTSLRAAALERYSRQPGDTPGWIKALARKLARDWMDIRGRG